MRASCPGLCGCVGFAAAAAVDQLASYGTALAVCARMSGSLAASGLRLQPLQLRHLQPPGWRRAMRCRWCGWRPSSFAWLVCHQAKADCVKNVCLSRWPSLPTGGLRVFLCARCYFIMWLQMFVLCFAMFMELGCRIRPPSFCTPGRCCLQGNASRMGFELCKQRPVSMAVCAGSAALSLTCAVGMF